MKPCYVLPLPFGKFSAVVMAFTTIIGFAAAQEAASQSNSTNFLLIDYGINLSADGEENDTAVFGPDEDGGQSPLRLQDGVIDETSGFIGIGIGHRYANNIGAVLRYESGELDSGTINVEIAAGSDITEASAADAFTKEVESFFLEGAYFMPYSEQIELWGLVGVGQSEVTTSNNSVNLTAGGQSQVIPAICKSSEDNTATRFGAGATYYLSQTHGFYGGVTLSNYGDASFKATDENDVCTNQVDTFSVKDIDTTDLRIGYFRSF